MGLAGVLIYVNWQTYVYRRPHRAGRRDRARLLHQPDRHRVPRRPRAARAAAPAAVGRGRHQRRRRRSCSPSATVSCPWIALILAFSFGLYGLIKKRVGGAGRRRVRPDARDRVARARRDRPAHRRRRDRRAHHRHRQRLAHRAARWRAGVVTAVPLLLFAAAARRLPLIYMGFIQYVAPVLQFLVGVFVLHEAMPPERWVGFALVWVALLRAHDRHGRLGADSAARVPRTGLAGRYALHAPAIERTMMLRRTVAALLGLVVVVPLWPWPRVPARLCQRQPRQARPPLSFPPVTACSASARSFP